MNLGHKSLPKVNHALVHSNTTFYQPINVHPSKASTTTTTTTTTDQQQVTIFSNATKLGAQPKKALKHNNSENNIIINQNKSRQNNQRQNEITTKITNTSESPRSASISPRPSHTTKHPSVANNPLEKHRQRLLAQTTPIATTPLVINYDIQPMTQQQQKH